MRFVRAFLAGLLLVLAALSTAWAKAPVVLDAAARSALTALPPLRGEGLAEGDLAGKIVILAFFASWCPPCHPEFDHLKAIDARYGAEGVTVVAVNIFENFGGKDGTARLNAFLTKKSPGFHVLGEGEAVAPTFGKVARIPTVLVFDRAGQPVMHFIHERGATKTHTTYEELEAAVREAD